MARSGYEAAMRVWKGASKGISVVWYRVPDDAPFLPFAHPWGSRKTWDRDLLAKTGEPGELAHGAWYDSSDPHGSGGGHYCGTDAAVREGGVHGRDPSVVVAADGSSPCCGGETVATCGYTYRGDRPWLATWTANPAGRALPLDGLILVLAPLGLDAIRPHYYAWKVEGVVLPSRSAWLTMPERTMDMTIELPTSVEPTCDMLVSIVVHGINFAGAPQIQTNINAADFGEVDPNPLTWTLRIGGTAPTMTAQFEAEPSATAAEDIVTSNTSIGGVLCELHQF